MPMYVNAPDDIDFSRPGRAVPPPAPINAEAPKVGRCPRHDGAAALKRAIREREKQSANRIGKASRELSVEYAGLVRDPESRLLVSRKEDDAGTAPTRAKLKPDTLLWMRDRDQLSQEAYDAALSIRAAYMLITIGMDARVATYGEAFGGRGDTWEAAWAVQMQELYNDWCDLMAERAAAAQKVHRGTRRWQTSIVLDVAIDGKTCVDIGNERGMCRKAVADILRDALDLYLDIKAGKVRAPTKIAA